MCPLSPFHLELRTHIKSIVRGSVEQGTVSHLVLSQKLSLDETKAVVTELQLFAVNDVCLAGCSLTDKHITILCDCMGSKGRYVSRHLFRNTYINNDESLTSVAVSHTVSQTL
eukprot:m.255893 g.255893  ORF g.255893 m.255893 type:complete len:113 (-) comp15510_c5_seq1:776-1114(-)